MINLHLITMALALVFFVSRDENHPPVVKIMQPKTGSSYTPNSQVRYTISVSDKEDGDSKYQEINASEVLLQVKYISSASTAQQESLPVHEGLQSILQSNCLNCHAFNAPLLGPSFVDINKKYRSNASAANTLVKRIMQATPIFPITREPKEPCDSLLLQARAKGRLFFQQVIAITVQQIPESH